MTVSTLVTCDRCGHEWRFLADKGWIDNPAAGKVGCPECGFIVDLSMDRVALKFGGYEDILHRSIWGRGIHVMGASE